MNAKRFFHISVFLSAAGLLVGSMVFMYRMGLILVHADEQRTRELLVLRQLEGFTSTLRDTETSQRGYLLTGEEVYLESYKTGSTRIQAELDELLRLASRGELPTEKVEQVIDLTRQKLAELDRTIQVRRDKGLDAVLLILRDDVGKKVMDQIRDQAGQMRDGLEEEFKATTKRAGWAAGLRTVTYIGAGSLNLAFLGWMFGRISREMRRREAVALELSREKELLRTTLASIGDAVIITDLAGRATFLNAEAERLTGWKATEAHGQALPAVFRIINEDTRQPAENPAEKVLRLGTVVGLANHTLLVARNGAEIPIDDSAAPIRQPDGPFLGVVLVFRDFSEQRKAQQVLARGKEELEKLVEERTAKLREMVGELEHVSYAIVHDMRAPLRAMQAFAQLLEATEESPEERKGYARRIRTGANRLDRLIQDALTYNKAVLREVPLEPVDLSRLLREIVETYPNLDATNADILIEKGLPVVLGSEALLTECFSNLLGNAVKFVAQGTRPNVRVRAERRDGTTRIWVEDNGIGISKQAQQRLFGLFQRLTNDYEGTGIGLAIVRKVVERMGGKAGAESEPGKGSRFWVELAHSDGSAYR